MASSASDCLQRAKQRLLRARAQESLGEDETLKDSQTTYIQGYHNHGDDQPAPKRLPRKMTSAERLLLETQ